jgi:hypothetical protein
LRLQRAAAVPVSIVWNVESTASGASTPSATKTVVPQLG